MNIIFKTLYLTILILPAYILAGEKGGNGGDAVVCRDERRVIHYLETLDSYEARVLRGIHIQNIPESLSTESAYTVLMNRLSAISPKRAEEYRSFIEFFFSHSKEVDDELVNIPDSDHYVFPEGCKVEQLIIQKEPDTQFDVRFLIQKKLWKNLSGVQKAIMILHEAFLFEAMTNQKKLNWDKIYTRGVRYSTSLIFGFEHSLTEETFVNSLLMIPNFYQAELKHFGEVILRDKKGKIYWNAIKGFDEKGFANDVVLLPDPIKQTQVKKLGKVRFFSTYNATFQPRVKFLSPSILRVNGQGFIENEIYDHSIYLDSSFPREEGEIVFSGRISTQVGGSALVDFLKGTIVGIESYTQPAPSKINLSLSGFKLVYIPEGGVENYAGKWKINYDAKKNILSYTIHGKYLGAGHFLIGLKNRVFIRLHGDGLPHTIAFNEEKLPIEDFVHLSYISENKIYGGKWYPSRNKEKQFEAYPERIGSFIVKFLYEPLQTNWSNVRRLTSESFSMVIAKGSKRKCIKVKKGTSWPVSLADGWKLWDQICH